ncbi:MAG: hypothetical protein WDZ59_02660 [Pirellulales bacterium]
MSHPLLKRLSALRRRARRLIAMRGLCQVAAVVVALVVLLTIADYAVRFQDEGIRVLAAAVVVAVTFASMYRFLYLPSRARLSDVDLARRVEDRFSHLGDRLSSAVSFLRQPQDDPLAGSASMRQRLIVEVDREVKNIKFTEVLNRRPARRAAAGALVAGAIAVALVAADASSARVAISRLALPLRNIDWPRRNALVIKDPPRRLAVGDPFEVEVSDANGRLPAEVRIHYRFRNEEGGTLVESAPMRYFDADGGIMVARREDVRRPFEYRAEGGDDQTMPWMPVAVVEPPRVDSLQVELHPPKYTGWPVRQSRGAVRALRGTRIAIVGKSTSPLRTARLQLEGGQSYTATIGDDRRTFRIESRELTVQQSGAYWFALEDTQSMIGGEDQRWEIDAVADSPPTVAFQRPTSHTYLTPQAVLPIHLRVSDDIAVREVTLAYQRSDSGSPDITSQVLYAGPETPPPPRTSEAVGVDENSPDERQIELDWDLAALGLEPDTQLTVHGIAEDYLPQRGQTAEALRVTIISPEKLRERLAERESLILDELSRALVVQREARDQTNSIYTQQTSAAELNDGDVDRLQSVELNQRQLRTTLASGTEGIPSHIGNVLEEMAINGLGVTETRQRLEELAGTLDRLDREQLSSIGRELTSAIKSAQTELVEAQPSSDTPFESALTGTLQSQDQVIATLESLLGDLSQWADYRRFARELGQLRDDQRAVQQSTADIAGTTLTQEPAELDAGTTADLQTTSRRQAELAERFDQLQQSIGQAARQLAADQAPIAATLQDAFDRGRQHAISGRMRQIAAIVQSNQLGQAMAGQATVLQQLDTMLDALSTQQGADLRELSAGQQAAEAMDELRTAAGDMARRQQETLEATRQLDAVRLATGQLTGQHSPELREIITQQQALREDAAQLADRTAGEGAFHLAISSAAESMAGAENLLQKDRTDSHVQRLQEQSLKRLEQLVEALRPVEAIQDQPPPDDPPGESGEQGDPQELALRLAELKLLRQMQLDINARSRTLADELTGSAQAAPDVQNAYDQLRQEQGRLAALILHLADPTGAPVQAPDSSPPVAPESEEESKIELPPLNFGELEGM